MPWLRTQKTVIRNTTLLQNRLFLYFNKLLITHKQINLAINWLFALLRELLHFRWHFSTCNCNNSGQGRIKGYTIYLYGEFLWVIALQIGKLPNSFWKWKFPEDLQNNIKERDLWATSIQKLTLLLWKYHLKDNKHTISGLVFHFWGLETGQNTILATFTKKLIKYQFLV